MPQEYACTTAYVREETPTVYTLGLSVPSQLPRPKPGQFYMIASSVDGKVIRKPYSYCSFSDSVVEFCIKRVDGGMFSNYLGRLKHGDPLSLSGPFGIFLLRSPIERDVLFLASGSGISSLKAMILPALEQQKHTIWLFFGVKNEEEIIYRKEFEALKRTHQNFRFVPVMSRQQWEGECGHVQDVVPKYIPHRNADIYICGVPQMVDDCKMAMKSLGFNHERIFVEKYE